jgi:hypothetical protein
MRSLRWSLSARHQTQVSYRQGGGVQGAPGGGGVQIRRQGKRTGKRGGVGGLACVVFDRNLDQGCAGGLREGVLLW